MRAVMGVDFLGIIIVLAFLLGAAVCLLWVVLGGFDPNRRPPWRR